MKGTIMANNTFAMGVVSAVSGEAFARGVDGQMRRLALGDSLYQGDVVITASGSSVQVAPFNAPDFNVGEQQTVAVDTQSAPPDALAPAEAPLAAVTVDPAAGPNFEALLEEEAAAAGLGGGEGGGGHSFVDLARINEVVSPVGYEFPTNPTGQPSQLEGLAGLVAEVAATTPTETTPTETTPTETTPTETTPTETTPTETTPTETTPTETTPTETTPTETTPTETTPTETTPTETTPTETTPTETTPTETTPTETTPTETTPTETTPTETTPTETTPTETTPTETTPTETTPTETTPTETTPTETTPTETTPTETTPTETTPTETTPTDNYGWFIAHQGVGNQTQAYALAEGDANDKQASATFNVQFQERGGNDIGKIGVGETVTVVLAISGSADVNDFALDVTSNGNQFATDYSMNPEGTELTVTLTALREGNLQGSPFEVTVQALDDGLAEGTESLGFDISSVSVGNIWEANDQVQYVISDASLTLKGSNGPDNLVGGSGDDTLSGRGGDDVLTGGPGDDALDGDAGADTFSWSRGDLGSADDPAYDTIHDFSLDDGDKLDLSSVLDGNDYNLMAVEQNGHVVLQITDVDENLVQSIALPSIEVEGQNQAELALQAMLDADQVIMKTG
jgi:hypothetical protein